jgi:dTDP-4-amino-4,6-dideoxygalactose transaminase
MKKKIFVTKPYLPPLEEVTLLMRSIWESGQITNCGPFHNQLESELAIYLGVKHISLFTNATIALMITLRFFNIKGEVITTPFSFVATSHSILWNEAKPVFVDIDPLTCNIDPKKIEEAITPNTEAILAVHCYGNPCDIHEIERIAKNHNLKVIYDAAHAFGVDCDCGSVLNHGDLSVLSFHATKVFNTFEGGAIISPNLETKMKIDQLKNFGFINETSVVATGMNGKMSEFNAALGCLQLKYIDEAINKRQEIDSYYRKSLDNIKGIRALNFSGVKKQNYSYFPIFIDDDYPISRDDLYEAFKLIGVFTRRYFYPLIPEFPMYMKDEFKPEFHLPYAYSLSRQVLCLPIFPDIEFSDLSTIVNFIKHNSNK